MITLEQFIAGLMMVASITGLVTEAIKSILTSMSKKYNANVLSGIVSVLVSICVGVVYVVTSNILLTSTVVVSIVGLAVASWLCAMLGYDKVIQAIEQIKTNKK